MTVGCLSCGPLCTGITTCMQCASSRCPNPLLGLSSAINNTSIHISRTFNSLHRRSLNPSLLRRQSTDSSTPTANTTVNIIIGVVILLAGGIASYLKWRKRKVRSRALQDQLDRIEEGIDRAVGGVSSETGIFLDGKPVPINPASPAYHMHRARKKAADPFVVERMESASMKHLIAVPLARTHGRSELSAAAGLHSRTDDYRHLSTNGTPMGRI